MADKEKEPWLTGNFFPRIGLILCQMWILVAVGSLVMVFVVWVFIFIQNIDVFNDVMDTYIGNSKSRYDTFDMNPGSGYVAGTNMPKQLGGAVFASLFAIAMWVFIFISLSADVAWRFPKLAPVFAIFHTDGLIDERKLDEAKFWFIFANAFLKIFIVVATGSTSFYGLQPDNEDVDTPLYCLYATFILLGSIPITMITNIVCVHAKRLAEWPSIFAGRKADIEASAKAEGKAAAEAEAAATAKAKAKRDSEKKSKRPKPEGA